MKEKLILYLKNKGVAVSSEELMSAVLKLNPVNSSTADKVVSGILKDEPGVSQTPTGFWQDNSDIVEARSSLSDARFYICLAIPRQVSAWQQWQAMGISESKERIFRIVKRSMERSLVDFIPEISGLINDTPLVFDGFGNQIGQFRRAFVMTTGFEPENRVLSLKRLAKKLYPDRVLSTPAQLANLLGTQSFDDAEPEVLLHGLTDQFGEILSLLRAREFSTMDDIFEFSERQSHDFSKYAFDEDFIRHLPHQPGVYVMRDSGGEVLYVGKARQLYDRVHSYFTEPDEGDEKLRAIQSSLYDIEIIQTGSELEALFVEQEFIRRYDPAVNRQLQVNPRRHRQKSRYPRIVILPGALTNEIKILFMDPIKGTRLYPFRVDKDRWPLIEDKIQEFFFQKADDRDILQDEQLELAASWLAVNEDAVNSIDMRAVCAAKEAVRLLRRHAENVLQTGEKVIFTG